MDAIKTTGLTKKYGRKNALTGVDLTIEPATVFGYLGANGAGKTTTTRILAGLIRPTNGTAVVFGLDAVRDREEMQRRIGYLPGEFVAYRDLTGRNYLTFLANLRGNVDWSIVDDLTGRLGLDLTTRIGDLSHGNRQKLGVVQAFMHQPDLLLLDEPTAGLDPLIQREFLSLVREAANRGQTVFLSSHVLSEVQAVADTIGILHEGHLEVVESVEVLKTQAVRHVDITFLSAPPTDTLRSVAGVKSLEHNAKTVRLTVEGPMAELFQIAAPFGIEQVVSHEPDLEEIFLSYYRGGGDQNVPQPVPQSIA